MFSENEDRVDANPVYQARLLKRMLDAGNLNQVKLAMKKGKPESWVSEQLNSLKLPSEALQIFVITKITTGSLSRGLGTGQESELRCRAHAWGMVCLL